MCLQITGCFKEYFKSVNDTCESEEELLDSWGNDSKDEVSVGPFHKKMKVDVSSIEPFPKIPFLQSLFTNKCSLP